MLAQTATSSRANMLAAFILFLIAAVLFQHNRKQEKPVEHDNEKFI